LGSCDVELLNWIFHSAQGKTEASDEQKVREDRAEEGSLDDTDETLFEGKYRQYLQCIFRLILKVCTISTMFPNVALIRPPIVWLVLNAISSVARPSNFASGIKERKLRRKTVVSEQLNRGANRAKGTKTKRIFNDEDLIVYDTLDPPLSSCMSGGCDGNDE
jgi:hypothetical protein